MKTGNVLQRETERHRETLWLSEKNISTSKNRFMVVKEGHQLKKSILIF